MGNEETQMLCRKVEPLVVGQMCDLYLQLLCAFLLGWLSWSYCPEGTHSSLYPRAAGAFESLFPPLQILELQKR